MLKNFTYLGIMHFSNLVVPLLVFPWLVQHLGIEKYGLVIYSHSLMMMVGIFTEYSFGLTAVRDIAKSIHDKEMTSIVFYEVVFTKLFLCLVSGTLLLLIVAIVPFYRNEGTLFLWAFGIVVGNTLLVNWFFQGVEQMMYIVVLNTIAKLLLIVSLYLFVKTPLDYVFVNIIYTLIGIVLGISSLFIVHFKYRLHVRIPTFKTIISILSKQFSYCISNLASTVSIYSTPIILGFFSSDFAVIGSFVVAERVYLIIRMIPIVIGQVIFPRIVQLNQQSKATVQLFYISIAKVAIPFTFLCCLLLAIFSTNCIDLITHQSSKSIAPDLLKIIIWGPFFYLFTIPFSQLMLVGQMDKKYQNVALYGMAFKLVVGTLLIYWFDVVGASASILMSEIAMIVIFYFINSRVDSNNKCYFNL